MIDKCVADTAAALHGVHDGATVMIGGFGGAGQPAELIDALIDQCAGDSVGGLLAHKLADTLKAAGYPEKADPAKMDKVKIVLILALLVVFPQIVTAPVLWMR